MTCVQLGIYAKLVTEDIIVSSLAWNWDEHEHVFFWASRNINVQQKLVKNQNIMFSSDAIRTPIILECEGYHILASFINFHHQEVYGSQSCMPC